MLSQSRYLLWCGVVYKVWCGVYSRYQKGAFPFLFSPLAPYSPPSLSRTHAHTAHSHSIPTYSPFLQLCLLLSHPHPVTFYYPSWSLSLSGTRCVCRADRNTVFTWPVIGWLRSLPIHQHSGKESERERGRRHLFRGHSFHCPFCCISFSVSNSLCSPRP